MKLPTNIVSRFEEVTRFSLSTYFNRYVDFISIDRGNILDYYSGKLKRPNQRSFDRLTALMKDAEKINSLIDIHRDRLRDAEYWELIDLLSQVEESLNTISNASKWLRSIITKNNFNPEVEISSVLNQMQTVENLSKSLGSNNSDNDWVKIALRNDLREEDYNTEGGVSLAVSFRNRLSIDVRSVVDNIDDEKIYGIDLSRKIAFEDNDLKALSYKETIVQAVNILSGLRQGHTPEFPQNGIQSSLVVGSNRMSVPYPVLFRQFYATFKKDDTLKSLSVKRIESDQDSISIDFEIETRLGEVIPTKTMF